MTQYCIRKKRINKIHIPKEFDISKIQIGVPVKKDEAQKVGLFESGDIVLPSGDFGPQSRKNAYGDTYTDKTKPKEYRCVATIRGYPFGNRNASERAFDVYKECNVKEEIPAYGIELELYENEKNEKYVIADLTPEIRNQHLREAINLLLEIYGYCYVFDESIEITQDQKHQRCNWEILPQGELPSKHVKKQEALNRKKAGEYSVLRLEHIEKYKYEKVVEGINGFNGYYAYIFDKCCVLESAIYGNATYIIPRENWEILSQKTKKELINEKKVIAKYEHTAKWMESISNGFEKLGIKLDE